ncbi:tyrosine-type recombinase/integrase [Rhodopseudomonas palustris]|uniref:tyrosine-type recombinase/integrase n=1 Tax=Rhodopseudomonas palustris TaxID=1076 RepID=UPI001603EF30|nr:tyrosine-type recombinase/integrase [Rhodopseudomonas palustris]
MKRKNPKHVHEYTDRHGKARYYLRRPGLPKVALSGLPWSPEFMTAYESAMAGEVRRPPIGASRTLPGTVNAAIVSYYQSGAFGSLAASTRQSRRAILERFREKCGPLQLKAMPTAALQRIMDGFSPLAARNWKKALRGFVDHCIANQFLQRDPLAGVKLAKTKKSSGFHTWTVDEVAQYRAHHASGTKARLAMELLLQTGHARVDVVRMGRQHTKSGKLSMRRQKTGVQFDIPLLPELVSELDLQPKSDQLAFLTNAKGEPFTPAGFGNWFRSRCDQAGLPQCSAHGLRKAAAVYHALHGATAPELMAWFGWKTIGEAQRYIEEANRIKLAESAGAKLISRTAVGSPADPVSQNQTQAIEKAKAR